MIISFIVPVSLLYTEILEQAWLNSWYLTWASKDPIFDGNINFLTIESDTDMPDMIHQYEKVLVCDYLNK